MSLAKFSGMTTSQVAPAADGSTQVFTKVTAAAQIGDQAAEGDLFRMITNTDTAQTIYLGETAAAANGANAYPLAPGKDLCLLGPSGIGWKGDLYAKGNASAVLAKMAF
jgi:hypothetical protein